jgi:hypothetical protein
MKTDNNEVAATPTTMNPEEINRRIAIACGWIGVVDRGVCWKGIAPKCRDLGLVAIPDYHGDLNAMHEAEKWMHKNKSLKTFWDYAEELGKITPSLLGAVSVIHATAAQRAEAFLRTIGKWEEVE